MENIECADKACERSFGQRAVFEEHVRVVHPGLQLDDNAEAVHTFDDIEDMVREAVREKYYKPGNYNASPPIQSIWAWVRDLSTDWVVFIVEKEGDETLYKSSYSILDNEVSLGEPVEVVKKTVYEPKQVKESV